MHNFFVYFVVLVHIVIICVWLVDLRIIRLKNSGNKSRTSLEIRRHALASSEAGFVDFFMLSIVFLSFFSNHDMNLI